RRLSRSTRAAIRIVPSAESTCVRSCTTRSPNTGRPFTAARRAKDVTTADCAHARRASKYPAQSPTNPDDRRPIDGRLRPQGRSAVDHEPDRGSIIKIVGTCRVVDALGEWGSHNTPWRAKRQISDASEGADFALTYYSQLVCGFLALPPFACVRAEISADDIPQLRLYD